MHELDSVLEFNMLTQPRRPKTARDLLQLKSCIQRPLMELEAAITLRFEAVNQARQVSVCVDNSPVGPAPPRTGGLALTTAMDDICCTLFESNMAGRNQPLLIDFDPFELVNKAPSL